MRKRGGEHSKNSLGSFCVAHLGMQSSCKCGFVYLVRLHWRIFPYKWLITSGQLEVASELGMGVCAYFSQHWLRPVQALPVHVATVSEFICISPVLSRRPCFLDVFHFHWLLEYFCFLFYRVTWAQEGRI